MRKSKKLISVFISLLLSLTWLAACSKGSNETASSSNDSKQAVELQFWDMPWGPAEYIKTAKTLVDQFNKENPGIHVKYQSTPWNNWYQTFSTAIASGTAPDISTGAGYQAFQFAKMGAILPIDDVIQNDTVDVNDFYQGSIDAMKYDGHYYALPWGDDIRVIYYRKDLFEKAGITNLPKTWDELRAAAKKLSGNGTYGMVMPNDTGGSHYPLSLMINNGGGLFTQDGKPDFTNPRNVEAINFLLDLQKDGSLNPAGAGMQGADAQKSFAQGKAAILIDGPGLKEGLPELKDKIGILAPLTGPHGDKGTINWINNIMIYKQSKHPEEAKKFLAWWSKHEKLLWTEGHAGQLPIRKSFQADPYIQNNPDVKFIIDNYLPVAKTTAYHDTSLFPELNTVEGQGFLQTMAQQISMGKNSKDIISKANTAFKNVLSQPQ